ncbi:MAG TPA: hypothetical protein VHP58_06450 [Alphaproteobacteria bacterium]|nr:hypothetical protein [Alphaproteobacteria bacterium]
MKSVLLIDRHSADALAEDIEKLKPLWKIVPVADHNTALQLIHEVQPRFDLVVINVGRGRCKLDPLGLLQILRLSSALEKSRFLVLLPNPWDERDNTAALAAGAHMVQIYPRHYEHTFWLVFKVMLKMVYHEKRAEKEMPLAPFYQFGISDLPHAP